MDNTQALKERIEAIRDIMSRTGWGYLHEGWTEELDNLTKTTLTQCNTEQDLWYRKGAASVLDRLVNLDKYLEAIEQVLDSPEPLE